MLELYALLKFMENVRFRPQELKEVKTQQDAFEIFLQTVAYSLIYKLFAIQRVKEKTSW